MELRLVEKLRIWFSSDLTTKRGCSKSPDKLLREAKRRRYLLYYMNMRWLRPRLATKWLIRSNDRKNRFPLFSFYLISTILPLPLKSPATSR